MDQFISLQPDKIYHIFNRAVGDEKLFRSQENYAYFLKKVEEHLLPVMKFFTYSLLPNHFHLMVRVRNKNEIIGLFKKVKRIDFDSNRHNLEEFIMERVSNCFNSYTKAYNKFYSRVGGLFMPTKRSIATIDGDITSFILYVHKNAVHHGLTKRIGEWKFDSYSKIIGTDATYLLRDELFEWFGSREEFIRIHENLDIERKP